MSSQNNTAQIKGANRSINRLTAISLFSLCLLWLTLGTSSLVQACTTANVVAIDQVFYYNRFGAANPSGMIYALQRDVVAMEGGGYRLREDKRPRPLVLRVNAGDCLEVNFTNLLNNTNTGNQFDPPPSLVDPTENPNNFGDQPATRTASFHVLGMQPVDIASDGSNVGQNTSSLVAPGGNTTYTFHAQKEGGYLAYSTAATTGGEGNGGTLAMGLFGAVNVEPAGSTWYRSQVTEQDLALAATGSTEQSGKFYPVLNYAAIYPEFETRKPLETLTLSEAGGVITATMTTRTSTAGFIPDDVGKSLIVDGVEGTIVTVNSDGSATIAITIPADTSGLFPVTADPYTWQIVGDIAHKYAGLPILKLTQGGEIVHSDLNAIIDGGSYANTSVNPNRSQPFREFSVIFHDDIKAVQAFPDWYLDPVLGHTLHSVRDGFAINYGTGGIGSEIIANRLGLGPLKDCVECKYEEFFLTSWALGDPAMVVDVPASVNASGLGAVAEPVPATKAFYPDDPSNVHHSYLNDHVKFRNIHAGPKEHHIFHLHAHQWVHSPDNENSAYLDSQAIGPGSAFTYEIAYNGSGNRNKTVGDSIFHCHFYPHFAQGMWELWRVHDVLETGTILDADGKPFAGSRAYPDKEILAGTPIPAVVPLPGMPMAPLPGVAVSIVDGEVVLPELTADATAEDNPGYPFFIPGIAGHRPPHPPLDTLVDGGLPRHVVTGGAAVSTQTRLNFNKVLTSITAQEVPETGTPYELAAMKFHGGVPDGDGDRFYTTPKADGGSGNFMVNGLPAQPGAPYADPCIDDDGNPAAASPRNYHVAAIQLDVTLNKAGWHFPQQRLLVLNDDVAATMAGTRPPEPLFFRANTGDCINFQHTNLVPNVYWQDDFQVTTPTDVIGQHIHLVKFDVTSSDGSGNGWNYEDGTFSPEEVHERLAAINHVDGDWQAADPDDTSGAPPVCAQGALESGGGCVQTTVQRWYADDVLNNSGEDRTLRTVFTHDHFGPSTHQHPGLYAGLVVEPAGSTWKHNETGVALGGRGDGGPTSWQAIIEYGGGSYREFMLEMGDFSLANRADGTAVNPPAKNEIDLSVSNDLLEPAVLCPGGEPRPCPEAISADDVATMTVNYRNEPVALRVYDGAGGQAASLKGDLSYALQSRTDRAISALNGPGPQPLTENLYPGDPYTPMLKMYEGDRVQIRILMGAQEEGHNFSAQGIKWLFEPSVKNSGYKSGQMLGISEHFEFVTPSVAAVKGDASFADTAYFPGLATDDVWNGLWGIMRVYNGGATPSVEFPAPTLVKLSTNPDGKALGPRQCKKGGKGGKGGSGGDAECVSMQGVCPSNAPDVKFKIHAYLAQDVLGGPLVYNQGAEPEPVPVLQDPGAILFVRDKEVNKRGGLLKPGIPIEPLILRANAGDCIHLELVNHLPATLAGTQAAGYSTLPMIIEGFNNNDILPSSHIGLTPQLLEYDVLTDAGSNIGMNSTIWTDDPATAAPGTSVKYKWYAGRIVPDPIGQYRVGEPVEYGAINLIPSDLIKHVSKGLFAALIIEPLNSTWIVDSDSRASATVTLEDGSDFREHVLIIQNDLNLQDGAGNPIRNLAEGEDPEDSGQKGFNYRSEPLWIRTGKAADTPLLETRNVDFTDVLSSPIHGDPETPIFTAAAGEAVRFRLLQPGGHARNHAFQIHGHGWQEEPFLADSTVIGNNLWSEWKGVEGGIGPGTHLNLLLTNGAGGAYGATGDFLYRDQASFGFDGGLWGIFRVGSASPAP